MPSLHAIRRVYTKSLGLGNCALLVWKHGVHVLGGYLENWAYHGQTQQLRFPLQPDWRSLPSLTRLNPIAWFVSLGLCLVVRHGLRASARSLSGCHTPDGTNLVPVLLTWHITLQPTPPSQETSISVWITWGGLGEVTG
jgi:hypothetical protein